MGQVFLARNPGALGLSKFVAIKQIRRDFLQDQTIEKLFKREAEVTIHLNHSNIASVYEVGIHQGSLYLVMEFVGGVSLKRILNLAIDGHFPLRPEDAIRITIETLSGLNHAHRYVDPLTQEMRPIIHCDVSPQNVLISFDGEIKIIDFGVAKFGGHDPISGPIWGKVDYMSPEHLKTVELDVRSDIYSAGIMMWELLSQQRYYAGKSPEAIRSQIVNSSQPNKFSDELPCGGQLQLVLDRMIEFNISQRYSTAEAVIFDLRRILSENYPSYQPTHFRELLNERFSTEIQELRNVITEFSRAPSTSQDRTLPINAAPSEGIGPMSPQELMAQLDSIAFTKVNGENPKASKKKAVQKDVRIIHEFKIRRTNFTRNLLLGLFLALILFKYQDLLPPIPYSIGKWFLKPSRHPANISKNVMRFDMTSPSYSGDKIEFLVESRPSGAQVIVNGQHLYRRTPMYLVIDPREDYQIQLEKRGFAYFSTKLNPLSEGLDIELIQISRNQTRGAHLKEK